MTGQRKNERMKKIMKKFLSLLLALTMVMSLIVVPANATSTDGASASFSISGPSTATEGDSVSFSISNAKITYNSKTYTNVTLSEVTWSGLSEGTTSSDSKTYSGTAGTESLTITCSATLSVTVGDTTVTVSSQTASNNNYGCAVTTKQAAFEAAVKGSKVTFNGRTYTINNSTEVSIDTFNSETIGDSLNIKVTGYPNATLTKSGSAWTAKSDSTDSAKSTSVTVTEKKIMSPTVTVEADSQTVAASGTVNAVTGQKVVLTADYSNKNSGNASYQWMNGSSSASSSSTYNFIANSAGTYNITVKVSEGTATDVATATATIVVTKDYFEGRASGGTTKKTLTAGDTWSIETPYLYNTDTKTTTSLTPSGGSKNCDIEWTSSNTQIATVNSSGVVTAGNRTGTATITATITYNTKEYTVTYTVNVKALDETLDEIENGDYVTYYYSDFEDDIEDILDEVLTGSHTVSSIKLESTDNVSLYDGSTKLTNNNTISKSFDLYAKEGFIGTASFSVKVNNNYVVTFYVPVTSAGTDIKESVTGSSTNGDVSFDVDDVTSGDYLYIKGTGTSSSFKPSTGSFSSETGYDGTWSGNSISGWERFAESTTVTIPASQFGSTGKLTLYVVSVDDDGIATVGTIEVTQKSYSIEYNVVAGESVTFDQDDFEDLFKEYAEDNGDQTTRKNQDYPYVEYSHVTIAAADLPATKSEGDLYYSSTALTSKTVKNEKFTDMDKMSFTAASKAKDTVTIPVTLVGTKYTSAKKSTDVKYEINVVISVVKEDIVYTVGVNDSVTFDARDFADYLNDYQTSYKKSTLDYVEFDVGTSNKLTATNTMGLLYQSYSSYYSGSLVESSNKFYYEPSKKQLDLGDVTYVTNRFSEAGKTVYIPFTVYGTKNEKAEGTLAIKVKNTMNFTDVVEGRDYFYDSVQWAVNNEITKGTSTTTFSPMKGCSRAEIVTFLWRAAGSPNPSKSTCSFKDVSASKHADYMKAIIWATEKGITDGTSTTTFSPDAVCTRAQIVTFLYRYAGEPASYGTYTFSDVSKTTHAAYYNAIQWAAYNGITKGNGGTTFGTTNTCNRAEAVTFLYRYFN